jgi:hypothetical protein
VPRRTLALHAGLVLALAAALTILGQAEPAAEPPPAEVPPAAADDAAGPFPPPVHQTRIEAVFDPETRRIDGRERLRWHNTASVPVSELQFHLYLNAFSSNQSTFMRGSGGEMRGARHDGRGWGWIEVESMELPDGTDLQAVEEFLAPEDANPHDRTVARYPLPEPLPPGGWIELDVEFTSQLPTPPFARTGTRGGYVLAGQWYPKIAVFEDAGDRGREEPGWNAHQFHPTSEFYADFGDYDVTLTLPERYRGKIGATGRLVDESAADGRVTVRYRQRGVHDFAWTADPDFRVHRARFEPAEDVPAPLRRRWAELLGLAEEEVALTPVDVELYLQPANAAQAGRYLDAAKAAIRGYGIRLGAYPYDTLTLVDPPLGALGSGGMEYPTFITLGTHPLLETPPFRGVLAPEVVTVHEFGHQFFQGMIASNEFEESWIDEGINTYYENEVMADAYGPASITLLGVPQPHLESLRDGGLDGGEFRDPVATPSWRFISGGSYGLNSYPRPGLVLEHLERLLGAESFHRAMRAFFQEHRFGHPTTADFERAVERASGRDLGWFFSQALHSTRNLDYAVYGLDNRRLREPRGVFWRGGERFQVPAEEEGEGDGDENGEQGGGDEGDDGDSRGWRSRVTVFRHGEFVHPVTVELTFADGTVLRREWAGERRWVRWTFTGPEKLVSAEVDPEGRLVLDHDRLNNSRRSEPDPAPALAFAADLLYWFQALLAATGLLA